MHRLSIVINDLFNQFLPLAEKYGVSLDLDFSDTTATVEDPELLKQQLEEQLATTLHRTQSDAIKISVSHDKIVITDPNTFLSKTACTLMTNSHFTTTSRLGFGTKITIPFKTVSKSQSETPQKAVAASSTKSALSPKTSAKSKSRSQSKKSTKSPKSKPQRKLHLEIS